MARLYLLRHAQALSGAGGGDSERALSERGQRDAVALGNWLRRQGIVLDEAVCSPARRARETWELLASRLDAPPEAVNEPLIYDAGPDRLIAWLGSRAGAPESLIVIGHNPTLHQVAFALSGTGDRQAIDRLTTGFPPGGLVELHLPGDWSTLRPGAGELRRFTIPQDLEHGRKRT